MTDPLTVLVGFVGRLRAAGVLVEHSRLLAAAQAVTAVPLLARGEPYWPLRLTLCARRADLPIFDAVYAAWSASAGAGAGPVDVDSAEVTVTVEADGGSEASGDPAAGSETGNGASDVELLARRDVRELTPAELAEIAALIALLAPAGRPRRATRRVPARSGRIDVGRTVRLMIRNGGEPSRILYRRRIHRPRRLLLLVDISKSMAVYSDILLLFAHAAVAAGPMTTEVFTIGTRWTRITDELRARRPDTAMRAIAGVESDWNGGTQLGRTLHGFLRRWGGHRAVRSAIIVIGSDGIEEGDQTLLPREVARLSRIAHRLVWVNPQQRRRNYLPLNAALRQSLPYADERLTGHSFEALRELAEVLGR